MPGRYRSSNYYPSSRSGGSFYGGYGSSSSLYSYNFGSYDASPSSNEYVYGRRRRRPYYWERDRTSYNRLRRNRRRRNRRSVSPPSRESSPEPQPEPRPEPPKEEIVKQLVVKDVDLNIKENTKNNKTDDYECTEADREADESGKQPPPELVVRRGNFMKLSVTCDRPYEKEKHDLRLRFSIGKKPSTSRSTLAQFKIDEDGKKAYDPFKWGAYLESRSGNDMVVMVHIAADCIVGEWNLSMKTFSEGEDKDGKDKTLEFRYEHDEDVIILFNPWCKEDGVFMENQDKLDEYILNENGCVYRGSAGTIGGKPWNFGQFEDGILDICLYLIRIGFKNGISKKMSDPVKVSRIIAKMVNSSDENGVLTGNWSGDYSDGVHPSKWVGSPKILKQFKESGPVNFGQCWVFSCLTTTVCRSVGIPCRSVTNFDSAHDSDASNLIEKVKNVQGDKVWGYNDSVWNFHVWNEAWMARPDLEDGFDGWQVIDATPQETSDDVYTCGPCPVRAVKEGRVDLNFDTSFVFSEVNADVAHFTMHSEENFELTNLETNKIGQKISTKVADGKPYHSYGWRSSDDKREDITLEYKYREGSEEERAATKRAFEIAKEKRVAINSLLPLDKRAVILDPYKKVSKKTVEYSLNINNEVMIGSDLQIEVIIKNGTSVTQDIWYSRLRVSAKTYTAEKEDFFVDEYFDGVSAMDSGEETSNTYVLTADEYFPHLMEQAYLCIEVFGVYAPTNSWSKVETSVTSDFRFRRPDLDVEGPEHGQKGQPVEFQVSFKNPVNVALTNCSITMGSSGFKDIEDKSQADVAVGGTYTGKFTMIPKRKKEHEVVFTFDCKEMKDISGSTSIVIS